MKQQSRQRRDDVSSTPSRRFERYTMWSLYLIAPMAPLAALAAVTPSQSFTWATVPHLVALVIAAVLFCPVVNSTVRRAVDGTRLSRWTWPFVFAGLAAASFGVLAVPAINDAGVGGPGGTFLISVLLTAAPFAPLPAWPLLTALAAGIGAATAAVWWVTARQTALDVGNARWLPVFFSASLIALGLFFSLWMSAWMLRQMREQAELSRVRAELAVAEERLRFSRDLHDIFGRTLTAVAVKSDLAAELATNGRTDDAVAEMREVHRLADEATREVRAVVGGYRVDLEAELQGARAMLAAAGIDVRIIGDGTGLPAPAAEALAWAVREGVTNVVRHSHATRCIIRLTSSDGTARLEITNDGAPAAPSRTTGSGIDGLRDRLAPFGGTVGTSRETAGFTLTATLPLEAR